MSPIHGPSVLDDRSRYQDQKLNEPEPQPTQEDLLACLSNMRKERNLQGEVGRLGFQFGPKSGPFREGPPRTGDSGFARPAPGFNGPADNGWGSRRFKPLPTTIRSRGLPLRSRMPTTTAGELKPTRRAFGELEPTPKAAGTRRQSSVLPDMTKKPQSLPAWLCVTPLSGPKALMEVMWPIQPRLEPVPLPQSIQTA